MGCFWLTKNLNEIYQENNSHNEIMENKDKKGKDKNPNDIKFLKDLIKETYSFYFLDNTFIVFNSNSINNKLYLMYSNRNKSIICYNLIDFKILIEIKNAHNNYITNFRHFFDKNNSMDLIISISGYDNNIKLWNVNNFECLYNFEKIYNYGQIFSACFLKDNNIIYIIASNSNFGNMELFKVYDLNGNKIKEISESNDNTFFIDIYYDNKYNKNYIITGNFGYVKSYDYIENKVYHKYNINDIRAHNSIIINNKEKIVKLIETSIDGNIRVWDFHNGNLLTKINIENTCFYDICLWDNNNLFVGCEDGTIKLIDLKNQRIVKDLHSHNKRVLTIKKIIHPIYEECLITQGTDNKIKLWK